MYKLKESEGSNALKNSLVSSVLWGEGPWSCPESLSRSLLGLCLCQGQQPCMRSRNDHDGPPSSKKRENEDRPGPGCLASYDPSGRGRPTAKTQPDLVTAGADAFNHLSEVDTGLPIHGLDQVTRFYRVGLCAGCWVARARGHFLQALRARGGGGRRGK
jgi:hypothetical protein